MRILALSDIHDRKKNFLSVLSMESYDLIVVSGDFTYYRPIGHVMSMISEARKITDKPIFFVPGNCDPLDLLEFEDESLRFYNLHRRVRYWNNTYFSGFGGSTITPFNTIIEFSEESIESALKILKEELVEKKFVFVTHVPPYKTLDRIAMGEHAGSVQIRRFVEELQPMLVVSGHIHESRGKMELGKTIIVNPGPLMRGYYATIDLGDEIVVELKNI